MTTKLSNLVTRVFRKLFAATAPVPAQRGWNLDAPLIQLSQHPGDYLSLRSMFSGVFIMGSSGSGKTSGSGATLLSTFLRIGMGGLILTTKVGETAELMHLAHKAGRIDDVVLVSPQSLHRYNMMNDTARRTADVGGMAGVVVGLYKSIIELLNRGGGHSADSFWSNSVERMLYASVETLLRAGETVSLKQIYQLTLSAPTERHHIVDEHFKAQSYLFQCLAKIEQVAGTLSDMMYRDYETAATYWISEFLNLDPRTRSSIIATFSSVAAILMSGWYGEIFGTTTTFTPEVSLEGKIIIVDFPAKAYGDVGVAIQCTMKFCWQAAIERRNIRENNRPVFCWIDEAQTYCTRHGDIEFLATARSALCANVYLTQSVSVLYTRLGQGQDGKAATDALLANFSTRFFHSQSDVASLHFAEQIFGRRWKPHVSTTQQAGRRSSDYRKAAESQPQFSSSVSYSYDANVPASTFTTLRTGGPMNNYMVDAVVFSAGRTWAATQSNWIKVSFRQG